MLGTGGWNCYGNKGGGWIGSNLTDGYWIHSCTPEDTAISIIEGYPDKEMLAYGCGTKLSNEQVQQLVSYIATLQGTNPESGILSNRNSISFTNLSGSVVIYFPNDSAVDQQIELSLNREEIQYISSSNWAKGKWVVKVSWTTDYTRYDMQEIFSFRRHAVSGNTTVNVLKHSLFIAGCI